MLADAPKAVAHHEPVSSLASAPPLDPRVALSVLERSRWQELFAASLHYSGAQRLLERISRRHELRSAAGSGLPHWRRVQGPRFAILCYHRIGTEGVPLYSYLPAPQFEAQIRLVHQRYRVVSLEQLCSELENGVQVPPSVAVTFDDGYRDVYTYAFPILAAYGVPATIYATVGAIERGEVPWYDRVFVALQVAQASQLRVPFDPPREYPLSSPAKRFQAALEIVAGLRRLPDKRRKEVCAILERQIVLPQDELAGRMLTWEQVRTMHRAGIAFGSHTMTHPVVSQLDSAELDRELGDSRSLLEAKLDAPVRDFAFPFGQPADCGRIGPAILAQKGYRSAATTSWGINRPGTDPYALRRVQIGEECSLPMFAFKLNQLFFRSEESSKASDSPRLRAQEALPAGKSPASGAEG
jgi:peptidoglycan/xylan/chitin deacetylase (PgdA/CDA1 family)